MDARDDALFIINSAHDHKTGNVQAAYLVKDWESMGRLGKKTGRVWEDLVNRLGKYWEDLVNRWGKVRRDLVKRSEIVGEELVNRSRTLAQL